MRYLTITSPDINNGLGCRVTVWIAGCGHHCLGCHNQHTWEYNQGQSLNDEFIDKVFNKVRVPYIKGITISGGDPLDQDVNSLNELYKFLLEFKREFPEKDIWLYSGFYLNEILKDEHKVKILKLCDVLVDGPYIQSQRDTTLPFRGSKNQHIINVKDLQL